VEREVALLPAVAGGLRAAPEEEQVDLDGEACQKILSLATDFPRLWRDPATPQSERKRMVRLLIEDVALTKEEKVIAKIRFKGGAMRTLVVARLLKLADQRRTQRSTVEEVDRLLDKHTVREIAEILRERGLRSGAGGEFTVAVVRRVLAAYKLKTRYQRLRAAGLLTSTSLSPTARLGTRQNPEARSRVPDEV